MTRMITVLLWFWVAAAFAAYMYQFRSIAGAIGQAVGLW
jgi:hypothetical protein